MTSSVKLEKEQCANILAHSNENGIGSSPDPFFQRAVWNETTWQIALSKLLKKVDEHKLGIRCVPRPTERLGRGGGEEQLGDTSRGPMKLFYFYLCGLRLHADYFSFALSIALSE